MHKNKVVEKIQANYLVRNYKKKVIYLFNGIAFVDGFSTDQKGTEEQLGVNIESL